MFGASDSLKKHDAAAQSSGGGGDGDDGGGDERQTIVVTARVHPGETNSSWMMKGLLEFITSQASHARVSRNVTAVIEVPSTYSVCVCVCVHVRSYVRACGCRVRVHVCKFSCYTCTCLSKFCYTLYQTLSITRTHASHL